MKTPREVVLSHYRNVDSKLERMWPTMVAACRPGPSASRECDRRGAPLQLVWRELIWPCRRIWAGLACAWALIIATNLATSQPAMPLTGRTAPPSREEMQALAEQRRMLAQLIGEEPKTINKQQLVSPDQRSERTRRISVA